MYYMSHPVALQDLGCYNNTGTSFVMKFLLVFSLLSHPALVAQWLERLHGKRKVLGSIPGLGNHFLPKHDCSLHQEQSLKSSLMIGKDLRQNTLAWYTCPDRCINVWLRPEDHQLWLENFHAPSFPQMGHWNSILCSRLNLDSTILP